MLFRSGWYRSRPRTSLRSPGAADHTSASGAAAAAPAPTQTQELATAVDQRRWENLSKELSKKNSRKRNWRSAAQPARAGRSAGGARRSAPPRARTREIRAIKGNAAPFLLILQSRCASESKRPPVQCCFDRGGIEVDPVPRCARPAPPTTPSNPAPRRPHQPQPKLRNWRRRPAGGASGSLRLRVRAENLSKELSKKNSRKRNWRSAAQPARAGRSAGGARRSAPPRARTREISAIKVNAAPFLLMLQSRCASESKRPPVQCCFDRGGIEVDPVPRCARPAPPTTPANPAPRRPHQPQPKLRNWRRRPAGGARGSVRLRTPNARWENLSKELSKKNSRKRNWRSAAQPARAGRSAGGARRSAPPRARTREISAIKGNAAPFLLILQSRCASESKRPPVQCCFDRGGIEVDPVPRCARPAPPTTPANPAPRRPHQPQPKLRNWRRRLTNVAGKISQKNSLKRTLEKEIGEAPPSRLERVGLLAERVARLRLARARGKFAPLRETPPLFC